jgi:hypothetical protein
MLWPVAFRIGYRSSFNEITLILPPHDLHLNDLWVPFSLTTASTDTSISDQAQLHCCVPSHNHSLARRQLAAARLRPMNVQSVAELDQESARSSRGTPCRRMPALLRRVSERFISVGAFPTKISNCTNTTTTSWCTNKASKLGQKICLDWHV